MKKPDEVYLPTDDLKTLIGDMDGVLFADKAVVKNTMHNWMKKCGALDHLRVCVDENSNSERREALYSEAGEPPSTRDNYYHDRTITKLEFIFDKISNAEQKERENLAKLLWDQLKKISVTDKNWHEAKYFWFRYRKQSHALTSSIKQLLKKTSWITTKDGEIKRPSEIVFNGLKWDDVPSLRDHVLFKPAEGENAVNTLVREYNLSPEDKENFERILRNPGILKTPEGREFLERMEPQEKSDSDSELSTVQSELNTEAIQSLENESSTTQDKNGKRFFPPNPAQYKTPSGQNAETSQISESDKSPPSSETRNSYRSETIRVSVISVGHPYPRSDKETENAAIDFVHEKYPELIDVNNINPNNPGYDLYDQEQDLFIEVKGLSGEFSTVQISKTQFECAWEKKDKYWLYVVEHAKYTPKLYRLQNPVRRVGGFAFYKSFSDWEEE